MASLIACAIDALKANRTPTQVTSQWSEWLKALRTYVVSLSDFAHTSFRRATITTGSWIVVFEDPVPTFTSSSQTNSETIHCFVGFDRILRDYKHLYSLLHRESLVDTLPLVLTVPQALAVLRRDRIDAWFYGLSVGTTVNGLSLKPYHQRTVYPAAIAQSGGRLFVVCQPNLYAIEPLEASSAGKFSATLKGRGRDFVSQLSHSLGVNGLPFRPLAEFPGFEEDKPQDFRRSSRVVLPQPGSTAERNASQCNPTKHLVASWGKSQSIAEFVVATGPDWFYKLNTPRGPRCHFHVWRQAQRKGVATERPHVEKTANSYTKDGQCCHCAHAHIGPLRQHRCHLAALEERLCCRACLFWGDCWANDSACLPCPT
jgi:hypothetical protein